jgi:hypothetical protein
MYTKKINENIKMVLLLAAFFLLAVGAARPASAGADAPADSLWKKAVALWGLNSDLVPGLMKMHMQEVDKHGQVKDEEKYHEVWSTLTLGDDGEVEYELVKVIENGEDVTEKERAKLEQEEDAGKDKDRDQGGEDSESNEMEGYSPFDPEDQTRVSFKAIGAGGIIDGIRTMLYEFSQSTDEDVAFRGKAWLNAATGAPVKVEYTTDPLPKRVKEMLTTVEYEQAAPDSLVVRKMYVDVTGGILFIKKHFHMDMTFDDHWRLPEDYESRHADEP